MPRRGRKRSLAMRTRELSRSFRASFGLRNRQESSDSSLDGGIEMRDESVPLHLPSEGTSIPGSQVQMESTNPRDSSDDPFNESGQDSIESFKEALKQEGNYSPAVQRLFQSIFNPPQTRGYNWVKHAGDWAPFESKFSYGLVRLFLSTIWSKRQWNLIRVFLIWLVSERVPARPAEVREYKAMMSLTGCLPGVGFATKVTKRYWKADTRVRTTNSLLSVETRELSQRESGPTRAGVEEHKVPDRKGMKEHTAEFFVHNLEVHLILQMMLPGAQESIQAGPGRMLSAPVKGIWETVACVRRDLLMGKYVVIRDRPSLLILREGCCIRNTTSGRTAVITSLEWQQPSEYLALRNAGLLPNQSEQWSMIHDRRPYVRIQMAYFERQVMTDLQDRTPQFSFVRKKFVVCFGATKGRVATANFGIQGRDWFRCWINDDSAGVTRSGVKLQQNDLHSPATPFGRRYPRRLIQIWALRRIYLQKQRETAELIKEKPVFCSAGWDAFSTTQFGSSHRGAVGYYVHVLNMTPKMPTLCFSVTDKSIPASCVVPELWKQMDSLQRLRKTLMCDIGPNGSGPVCIRSFRALLTAVCLDKEMLDPFHLSAASSAASRCDGALYRGCEDGLLFDDLCALDGRFLKSFDYTRRQRRDVINGSLNTTAFERVCTAEGWNRDPFADSLSPDCLGLNPYLIGVTDPMHTWDGVLERILRWCRASGEALYADFWLRMEEYVKTVCLFNGIKIPFDPFGLKKSERVNMKLRIRQSFFVWVGMHAVTPGNAASHCLRLALELLSEMYLCRSESQVSRVQDRTRSFLSCLESESHTTEVNLNFPKMRCLINIAFINLPLFRNTLFWENSRVESDHQYFKRMFRSHCNWKSDSELRVCDYAERVRGLQLLEKGLRFGPRLDWKLSGRARLMSTPGDSSALIFESSNRSQAESVTRRLQIVSEVRMLDQISDSLLSDLAHCLKKETCEESDIRVGRRVHICDELCNFEYESRKGQWLVCEDCEGRSFVIQEQFTVDVKSGEGRTVWLHGNLYLLTTVKDDLTIQTRRGQKGAVQHIGSYFDRTARRAGFVREDGHIDRSISGGDCLGLHWIPACTVLGPAFVVHTHLHGISVKDGQGCGFVNIRSGMSSDAASGQSLLRSRKWICDESEGTTFEVFDSTYLYQPRLFNSYRWRSTVENIQVEFNLFPFL